MENKLSAEKQAEAKAIGENLKGHGVKTDSSPPSPTPTTATSSGGGDNTEEPQSLPTQGKQYTPQAPPQQLPKGKGRCL